MVTANRRRLCRRAIRCYNRQTYPNRELVVVDDGEQSLDPVLDAVPDSELSYVELSPDSDRPLGALRNIALDAASGDFLTQWDDDDWYHSDRVREQAEVLLEGYDACCLHGTLMHLDSEEYFFHPYVGYLSDGVPGTIMHRNDGNIRYPEKRRAEDTVYLKGWKKKRFKLLSKLKNHLFIRCFHGENTWEKDHFMTRMRNTIPDAVYYFWYNIVNDNLFDHPRFKISERSRESFRRYLEDTMELDLIQTPTISEDRLRSHLSDLP